MTGMIVATGMSGAWIGVALGIVVLLVCAAPGFVALLAVRRDGR
jgi:hypothetical protein